MDWEVEGTKSQIKLTTLFGGLVWWPVGFEFNWYCKLPVLEVLLWENIGISSLVNDGQSWWTILFTITTLTTSVFANIYFRTQTFIVSWKFDHPTNPTFTRIPTVKQHPPPRLRRIYRIKFTPGTGGMALDDTCWNLFGKKMVVIGNLFPSFPQMIRVDPCIPVSMLDFFLGDDL